MNRVRNFLICIGVALVCVCAYLLVSVLTKSPEPALDFSAATASGEVISLSDNFQKRATVLIFIDPEVEGSLLVLDKVIQNAGAAEVLAISVSSLPVDEQKKLLNEKALALDKLCFEGSEAIETYNIGNAPITYFIDIDGLVQNAFVGNIKEETIVKYIEKITEKSAN